MEIIYILIIFLVHVLPKRALDSVVLILDQDTSLHVLIFLSFYQQCFVSFCLTYLFSGLSLKYFKIFDAIKIFKFWIVPHIYTYNLFLYVMLYPTTL